MVSADENHVIELLPDFVLDTLSDEYMLHVCEHLRTCPVCQEEYVQLQSIANELPLAITQTAPPAALKGKLMVSIQTSQGKLVKSAKPKTIPQKFAFLFRRNLPAFGIALIILLVLGNVLLWQQLNLVSQKTSSQSRVVTMTNTQFSPGAVGTLVLSPSGHNFTLIVDHLTILEPDKQYQVWLIKGAQHISAAVFSVDPTGYASLQIQAPEPLQAYDAVGISVEPSGGSPAPTGNSVLHGHLTN